MSKVVMMCGVCGSGKTTYAKQLEKNGFVRLSIDEKCGGFTVKEDSTSRRTSTKLFPKKQKLLSVKK